MGYYTTYSEWNSSQEIVQIFRIFSLAYNILQYVPWQYNFHMFLLLHLEHFN